MLGEVREDTTSNMGRAEQETFTVIRQSEGMTIQAKVVITKISYSLSEVY